jgi:hypothetical protein
MDAPHWQYGDTVAVRYPAEQRMVRSYQAITGDTVVNVLGAPQIVLEDSPDLVSVYMPEGTAFWRWNVREQQFREPFIAQGESVRLFFPGKSYQVNLFYDTGTGPGSHIRYMFPGAAGEGRFLGWKIDIASPFKRTAMGLEVIDEVLDLMVYPDWSYRWKDEDQMAFLVELGIYSADEADFFHSVGDELTMAIKEHAPPFDEQWKHWRPEKQFLVPEMPEGWQFLPLPAPFVAYNLEEDASRRAQAATRFRQRK